MAEGRERQSWRAEKADQRCLRRSRGTSISWRQTRQNLCAAPGGSAIPCRHQRMNGRRARNREPHRRAGRKAAASRSCPRQRSTQGQNRRSRLAQSHPSNIRTQVSRFCRKGRQGSTQRCFNLTSIASLPQSLDPRVIIFHAEADKSWSILMHRRLGKFKHQRISGIQGYVDLTAKDKIPVICSVSIGGV